MERGGSEVVGVWSRRFRMTLMRVDEEEILADRPKKWLKPLKIAGDEPVLSPRQLDKSLPRKISSRVVLVDEEHRLRNPTRNPG